MLNILTSLLLGLLMILDPCTLFTSIAAIGYIDKEINNRRKVLLNGLMFVFGKLVTYTLLAIPFIMGARTEGIKHFLHHWGEPLLAIFMLICGVLLLFTGKHHHEHDHGIRRPCRLVQGPQRRSRCRLGRPGIRTAHPFPVLYRGNSLRFQNFG